MKTTKKELQKVASQIATMRNGARLTQAQLADKLAVGVCTVSGWERAERLPKRGVFEQITKVCREVNPDAFHLIDYVAPANDINTDETTHQASNDKAESEILTSQSAE